MTDPTYYDGNGNPTNGPVVDIGPIRERVRVEHRILPCPICAATTGAHADYCHAQRETNGKG